MNNPKTPATLASNGLASLALSAALTCAAQAQTYTLVDLTPNVGNGVATSISGGVAAGYAASAVIGTLTRATLWDATSSLDLHPAFLDDATTGNVGRSIISDISGNLQVGYGAGLPTGGRSVPMLWRGSSSSATQLTIPFVNFGGQAHATDGDQIAGYAIAQDRDGTTIGPAQAMVWNAATGVGVSLGDGGNISMAYGVGGGTQVGFVNKGQATAALWRGTRQSQVSLHPKNAVTSLASATDGVRQAGYAGFDIRVRQEAAKGNKEKRFNYAHVWTGTAASALNIHPYPVNYPAGANLTQSYALGISGSWVVGYAGDETKFGTPAYSHAIVWDANYQSVDLNAFLPAGFVGAQATSVDENGNVSGFIAKADGTRHAAVWILNQAQ